MRSKTFVVDAPAAVAVGDRYPNSIAFGTGRRDATVTVVAVGPVYLDGADSVQDITVEGDGYSFRAFEQGALELVRGGSPHIVRGQTPR